MLDELSTIGQKVCAMKNSLTKHLLSLFVTCAIALALAGSVLAGPEPATGKEMIAPAPAPECNWTGFYLGINGGFFWARSVSIQRDNFDGFQEVPDRTSVLLQDTGVIGGGQIGYDWQFNRFVLGVEAGGGGLDFDQSDVQYGGNDNFAHAKYDGYAQFTGRIGWTWNKLLFYGKGGVGGVNVLNEAADLDGHSFDRASYTSKEDFEFTWIAGGGVEWMWNCNWSVRAEYDFYGIDDTHSTSRDGGHYEHDHELQAVTFGLNYRFR
jgi:outer membrane immunogenic protein